MNDREKALEQLGEIHSSIVDSEKFMPYNLNALIMWGFISSILFVFSGYFFYLGIFQGSIFLCVLLGVGIIGEYIFTKNENKKYDLQRLTTLQNFIGSIYTYSIIFGVVFTIVLVTQGAIEYISLLWIFIISLANYITGFSINCKMSKQYGLYGLYLSLSLLVLTLIIGLNEVAWDKIILIINNIAAILILGLGNIYMGLKLKKEQRSA